MAGRFSFSVPGRRGPSDPWFRVGTVDVSTTVFVVALGALSMLIESGPGLQLGKLVLFPDLVRNAEVWRVVTWPLYNPPSIWTVITLAMLWYFGRDLESEMGRRRFLYFILALIVIPGLVATGVDWTLFGVRWVEIGVFIAFAAEHPNLRFFFGIPAWVIAAVVVGIQMLELLDAGAFDGILVLLSTVAVALLGMKALGLGTELAWLPNINRGSGAGKSKAKRRTARKAGGNMSVVASPWDQAELDRLLDKMGSGGMSNLSTAEQKRLKELSKRLRDGS